MRTAEQNFNKSNSNIQHLQYQKHNYYFCVASLLRCDQIKTTNILNKNDLESYYIMSALMHKL